MKRTFIVTLDGDDDLDEEYAYFCIAGSPLGDAFSVQVREHHEAQVAIEPEVSRVTEEGLAACYICGESHSHSHSQEEIGVWPKRGYPHHDEDDEPVADLKVTIDFDVESIQDLIGVETTDEYEWLSDKDWQEVARLAAYEFNVSAAHDLQIDCVLDQLRKFNPPEPDYESMDRNEDR